MATIGIGFQGFHGKTGVEFRSDLRLTVEADGSYYPISARVAARLNREVCGVAGCRCEKITQLLPSGRWGVRAASNNYFERW